VPQFIKADQGKLRQTLINLMGNAVKFTETGGITLRVNCQEQTLFFEIEDTGVGISQEELDMVFEVFVQSSSGQKSKQGSGLGIPISEKFAQLMGGALTIDSEVGKGSVFRFSIQAEILDEVEIITSEPEQVVIGLAPGQQQFRVLVVEDSEPSRRMLVTLLKTIGFDVASASNGEEAIESWKRWQPHFIWMDLRMPILDGYEATRKIKSAMKKTASPVNTKIVALTASAFMENRAQAFEDGCDDFVRKPFREADIFRKMTKHLGVRFRYKDQPDSMGSHEAADKMLLTDELPVHISRLPNDLLEKLRVATDSCDADEIDCIIVEIRNHDEQLGDALALLSQRFAYQEIIGLIGAAS
jgi:CheY-like chemotaxis protein/anti-sigma regulatory factor (Ser/Thr protein kinase)